MSSEPCGAAFKTEIFSVLTTSAFRNWSMQCTLVSAFRIWKVCSVLWSVPSTVEICSVFWSLPSTTEICAVHRSVPSMIELCSVLLPMPSISEKVCSVLLVSAFCNWKVFSVPLPQAALPNYNTHNVRCIYIAVCSLPELNTRTVLHQPVDLDTEGRQETRTANFKHWLVTAS